jgi:hypothetical protein
LLNALDRSLALRGQGLVFGCVARALLPVRATPPLLDAEGCHRPLIALVLRGDLVGGALLLKVGNTLSMGRLQIRELAARLHLEVAVRPARLESLRLGIEAGRCPPRGRLFSHGEPLALPGLVDGPIGAVDEIADLPLGVISRLRHRSVQGITTLVHRLLELRFRDLDRDLDVHVAGRVLEGGERVIAVVPDVLLESVHERLA